VKLFILYHHRLHPKTGQTGDGFGPQLRIMRRNPDANSSFVRKLSKRRPNRSG